MRKIVVAMILITLTSCGYSQSTDSNIPLYGETELYQDIFQSLQTELDSIPYEFSLGDEILNDYFVYTAEAKDIDTSKIERFFEDYLEGKSSGIMIVSYTEEGDPILSNIKYDEDRFYIVTDNKRDTFGTPSIYQDYYAFIVHENIDGTDFYYLTNDRSFSYRSHVEKINKGEESNINTKYFILAAFFDIE